MDHPLSPRGAFSPPGGPPSADSPDRPVRRAPKPGSFRLVVVDVDGTLLDPSREVTADVREVVATAIRKGVMFTIATGRLVRSALHVAEQAGITVPVIANGGAIIADPLSRRYLRAYKLPGGTAEVLEATRGEDVLRYLFLGDEIFIEREDPASAAYSRSLGVPMEIVPDLGTHFRALTAAEGRYAGEEATMVVLRAPVEKVPALREKYRGIFKGRLMVTSTMPHFVDFMPPEATKAEALRELCEILGVGLDETIAIGDGINDLDMMKEAGLGVLVANASPTLWADADYVTSAPYHLGVAEVLHKFIS